MTSMLGNKFKHEYEVHPNRPPAMQYCTKCVYPISSAIPLSFNEAGECSGCTVAETKYEIDWDAKRKKWERLIEEYRSKDGSNYDCMIPVSGGKDSYYQIHLLKKVYGLNPLLVTYHANNYTETGMKNLLNMRDAFGVDHIFFTPNLDVIKSLNRLGMHIMGDMNWHCHSGILTYPIRVAVDMNVPLMVWGEHGYIDYGGMFSYSDMVEFTYRHRHEHEVRGFEWYDMIEQAPDYGEELTKQQLITWMYPSDEEIQRVGVRGIFVSNYFKWEPNEHTELMRKEYGFLDSDVPFERTYRTFSNLDDMHENGIHDYMKYIKFGYGRATDHVCKDIRSGLMTREKGIEIIRKMDPIKSNDLGRWLEYVGWNEEYFDQVADTFRDPRVWWKDENGNWKKDNIWD